MPVCSICGTVKTKLNPGDLCKDCFKNELRDETDKTKLPISVDEHTNIPITINDKINTDRDWKDSLLCNLYSNIEFLKNELMEKNDMIKQLIALQNNILRSERNNKNSNVDNSSDDSSSQSNSESFVINDEYTDTVNTEYGIQRYLVTISEDESDDILSTRHKISIDEQINNARLMQKQKFMAMKSRQEMENKNKPSDPPMPPNNLYKSKWKNNTCLIVGDSTLNGVQEKRMSSNNLIKVRIFSGAKIVDFYNYLVPLMAKCPSRVIIQAGCNDALEKSSQMILDELLQLKHYVESKLPGVKVTLSCPVIRIDNSKARLTLLQLRSKLEKLEVPLIKNENIDVDCLGRGGLHLNEKGYKKLAMNFITYNRKH